MAIKIKELQPRPRLYGIKVSVDAATYDYLVGMADVNGCSLARATAEAVRRGVNQMKAQEAAQRQGSGFEPHGNCEV